MQEGFFTWTQEISLYFKQTLRLHLAHSVGKGLYVLGVGHIAQLGLGLCVGLGLVLANPYPHANPNPNPVGHIAQLGLSFVGYGLYVLGVGHVAQLGVV